MSAVNHVLTVALQSSSLKALAIVVTFGAIARAAVPYLPLIGPVPLRFQAVKKPADGSVKFEAAQGASLVNSNNLAGQTALGTGRGSQGDSTNATDPAMASILNPIATNGPDSERTLSDSFTASVFELPEPDLVGISPEMLAMYFHPVLTGTNLATSMLQYPLSFTPPLPPKKESRAIYNVK